MNFLFYSGIVFFWLQKKKCEFFFFEQNACFGKRKKNEFGTIWEFCFSKKTKRRTKNIPWRDGENKNEKIFKKLKPNLLYSRGQRSFIQH